MLRNGKLTGHNTDSTGFAAAFEAVLGNPGEKPVALIGAGGVGRAIAFALAELGARALHIFDSDTAKANALAARLEARMAVRVCHDVAQALDGAGGVINGTPIGMLPNRDSPVPSELLHAGLFVADAVYTPLWTPLSASGARERLPRDDRPRALHLSGSRRVSACSPDWKARWSASVLPSMPLSPSATSPAKLAFKHKVHQGGMK